MRFRRTQEPAEDLLAFEEYGTRPWEALLPCDIEVMALGTPMELDMALTSALEKGNMPLVSLIGGIATSRRIDIALNGTRADRDAQAKFGELVGRALVGTLDKRLDS